MPLSDCVALGESFYLFFLFVFLVTVSSFGK